MLTHETGDSNQSAPSTNTTTCRPWAACIMVPWVARTRWLTASASVLVGRGREVLAAELSSADVPIQPCMALQWRYRDTIDLLARSLDTEQEARELLSGAAVLLGGIGERYIAIVVAAGLEGGISLAAFWVDAVQAMP